MTGPVVERRAEEVESIRPPGEARALNALSVGAIAIALGLVGIAAVPAWMKTSPAPAPISRVAVPFPLGESLPPAPAPHPIFDDEDDRSEIDRAFPAPPDADPLGPPKRRRTGHVGIDPEVAQNLRVGTTRHPTALLADPGDAKHTLGQLAANERVQVLKEQGDWVLVVRGGLDPSKGEVGIGWIKKSEIAIR